jgi:hypothetical protein
MRQTTGLAAALRAKGSGALAAWCIVLLAPLGCTGRLDVPPAGVGGSPDGGPGGDGGAPFEALAPAAAVAKVKNLLTGLPPTDAELAAVAADPAALQGQVALWTQTPQWTAKLRTFFASAFQQSQTTADEFQDQLGATVLARLDGRLLANFRESFARTAVELVAEGRPFTEVLTTRRFLLTPRLAASYAYLDALAVSDSSTTADLFAKANPGFSFTLTAQRGPIPIEQSLDPASPDFMVWYAPQLAKVYDPLCPQDPLVYDGRKGQSSVSQGLAVVLQGGAPIFSISTTSSPTGSHPCGPPGFPSTSTALTVADTQQWRMVTVRQPAPGEATTRLYDLATFRTGSELVLHTPRIGFFTTPSFLAGWNTNTSNQARVTLNQTLIVALNHGMTPENATRPANLDAVEAIHAAPGTDCFACHQSLDPMRQYFRQQFTFAFHPQTNPQQIQLGASFGFRGVTFSGGSLADLATQLAVHPDFATSWTQKLCTWANSAPCLESDPEFIRIAGRFVASGYDFRALVEELFSSPLVTFLAESQSADQNGQLAPVARRDHLCAALSNRLGLTDVCGLDVNTVVPAALQPVQLIASVLPSDQYSRGAEQPVLAADPSLFFRAGVENICAALAGRLVDAGATGRWTSSTSGSSTAAIADFVHVLMGVGPAGGRDAVPLQILTDHFVAAKAAGLKATDALRSTFVLSCTSPPVVGLVGMVQ